jgi:hypothetical protein
LLVDFIEHSVLGEDISNTYHRLVLSVVSHTDYLLYARARADKYVFVCATKVYGIWIIGESS